MVQTRTIYRLMFPDAVHDDFDNLQDASNAFHDHGKGAVILAIGQEKPSLSEPWRIVDVDRPLRPLPQQQISYISIYKGKIGAPTGDRNEVYGDQFVEIRFEHGKAISADLKNR